MPRPTTWHASPTRWRCPAPGWPPRSTPVCRRTAALAARLGATAITHTFLPGALLSRALGRQDCLGATMALRRETLAAVGGLPALVDHLADDNVLGRLVRARGLAVRLAPTVCATTVPETALGALFRHELRWARTILALVPAEFAASAIQYPLAWAALAVALSGGAAWALAAFALAWAGRARGGARAGERASAWCHAGLAAPVPVWLLPLRDLLSMAVFAASYAGDRVEWRGQVLHTALDKPGARRHIRRSRRGGRRPATRPSGDRPDDENPVPAAAELRRVRRRAPARATRRSAKSRASGSRPGWPSPPRWCRAAG